MTRFEFVCKYFHLWFFHFAHGIGIVFALKIGMCKQICAAAAVFLISQLFLFTSCVIAPIFPNKYVWIHFDTISKKLIEVLFDFHHTIYICFSYIAGSFYINCFLKCNHLRLLTFQTMLRFRSCGSRTKQVSVAYEKGACLF